MNASLFHVATALNANARWQELITQNIAASSIPGYRKQDLSFQAIQEGLALNSAGEPQSFTLPRVSAVTNFRPGELRYTGLPTDLAVDGSAFLAVQMPDGATAYTRDGEFQISSSGQLVTKQGYAVLGDSGPIQLDPRNPAPLSVSSTGEVSQGADNKGTIRLLEFNNPQLLTQINGGFFLANRPGAVPQPADNSTVRQGFLETANTSPTLEMANLILAMRMYEANQRLIQGHDERMGRTISELGNPA